MSILTSCVCFLFVGDFLPPPPPPLDDAGALPSGSGNFPPPPPLDEGAFRAQVRSVLKVMFISQLGSSWIQWLFLWRINIYPEPTESFTTHTALRHFNAKCPTHASQSSASLYSDALQILLPTNFVLKLKTIFLGMPFEKFTVSCYPRDTRPCFFIACFLYPQTLHSIWVRPMVEGSGWSLWVLIGQQHLSSKSSNKHPFSLLNEVKDAY